MATRKAACSGALPTSIRALLSAAVLCTFCFACAQGEDDDSGSDVPEGTSSDGTVSSGSGLFSVGTRTDSSGVAVANFAVSENTTKFTLTALAPNGLAIAFNELSSSAGTNYLDPSGLELGLSLSPFEGANAATAPSRSLDPAIQPGNTFITELQLNRRSEDQQITLFVDSVADSNLSSGTLPVRIFYVGDIGSNAESRSAVRSSLDEFRRIYSRAGINLEFSETDIAGPSELPSPLAGSSFYNDATEGSRSLNIFIGGLVAGDTGSTLGIAGGIPGPSVSTLRSAVVASIIAGSGPDGEFSNSEIRVLGETLAHESGHFLGLFHPIDFSGDRVGATDPLPDTDSCSERSNCVTNDSLAGNLMFPTTVSIGGGETLPQNDLTPQQASVLNRYAPGSIDT